MLPAGAAAKERPEGPENERSLSAFAANARGLLSADIESDRHNASPNLRV